ncbi:MAG TPA: imidazole glycerol phosphate synthase subunit HisF [Phycisphaerales bacterium]
MLTRRIIPCLDVRSGRVVKGVRFQGLRDAGDPAELAARYESEGADEITLLDVSATPEARGAAADTIARVRRVLSIPLTVGGGVREVADAGRLLDAGADKVGVNTAAVARPALISECAHRFGAQCVVVAIDAALAPGSSHRWHVRVRSGEEATPIDAVEWARRAADLGAGEILLTSWDRDGTRSGYDLALTRAVASAVRIPVIASGGAAGPEHLLEALRAGAEAVLAASIFHDGEHTVASIKQFLASRGVEIRP